MEEQLLVNNLLTKDVHFQSKKTFSRRKEWISELDTCIVSNNLINIIESSNVIRDNYLPSDHAPIVITMQSPSFCLQTLTILSSELGKHGAELITTEFRNSRPPTSRPPVQYKNVDLDLFLTKINEIDAYAQFSEDVNEVLSETLYRCAAESRYDDVPVEELRDEKGRWNRMLEDNDQTELWQAIDWNGEIVENVNNSDSMPDDAIFKDHSEQIFNPPNTAYPNVDN